jgi:hypothetical protein
MVSLQIPWDFATGLCDMSYSGGNHKETSKAPYTQQATKRENLNERSDTRLQLKADRLSRIVT